MVAANIKKSTPPAKVAAHMTRVNAYPFFGPSERVCAEAHGWRRRDGVDARVIVDAGPPHEGSRRITLEKVSGIRAGERIVMRRDRVRSMPEQ